MDVQYFFNFSYNIPEISRYLGQSWDVPNGGTNDTARISFRNMIKGGQTDLPGGKGERGVCYLDVPSS